jgi:hypothetical protein
MSQNTINLIFIGFFLLVTILWVFNQHFKNNEYFNNNSNTTSQPSPQSSPQQSAQPPSPQSQPSQPLPQPPQQLAQPQPPSEVPELVQNSSIESGTCYNPNKGDRGDKGDKDENEHKNSVINSDLTYIKQLSKVEDANDYNRVVTEMRNKYKKILYDTLENIDINQDAIQKNLSDIQTQFDKYGVETLAKTYYGEIYKYGDFAAIKNLVR